MFKDARPRQLSATGEGDGSGWRKTHKFEFSLTAKGAFRITVSQQNLGRAADGEAWPYQAGTKL
ncbi:hypothetical protein BFS13_10000 [Pantoea sp. Ae16]|nr:hypothetical protein BFS13_10000 [Pantoea sp. Ae16]